MFGDIDFSQNKSGLTDHQEKETTRTLILIRHANAVSPYDTPIDFERTLTHRGRAEALLMANRLQQKLTALSLEPNLIIASPAARTQETATIFLETLVLASDQLQFDPSLYHPQPSSFYAALQKAPAAAKVILVVSHNNGITDFANQLTTTRVDVMPTCSIAAIQWQGGDWADFEGAHKQWLFFDYPALKGS